MSGPEGSSTKQILLCAAGVPAAAVLQGNHGSPPRRAAFFMPPPGNWRSGADGSGGRICRKARMGAESFQESRWQGILSASVPSCYLAVFFI